MEPVKTAASGTETKSKGRSTSYRQSTCSGRYFVDTSHRSPLARYAGSIPKPIDVLEAIEALGRHVSMIALMEPVVIAVMEPFQKVQKRFQTALSN
jgi:hypothetical protein